MPRTAAPTSIASPSDSPSVGLAARLLLDCLQDRAAPDELLADVRAAFPAGDALADPDAADRLELRAALVELADVTARILSEREFQYRTVPATLESAIAQQVKDLNSQEMRFVILRSYADALQQSASWRLFAPLRAACRLLRPRGFTARDLLPWRGLEPVAGAPLGHLEGDRPRPAVHRLVLPAGRLGPRASGDARP